MYTSPCSVPPLVGSPNGPTKTEPSLLVFVFLVYQRGDFMFLSSYSPLLPPPFSPSLSSSPFYFFFISAPLLIWLSFFIPLFLSATSPTISL